MEPLHDQLGLPSDYLLHLRHRRHAPVEILVEGGLEFVDVVKHHARERPHTEIDVPRNGYVDHDQGDALPAAENGRHVLLIDDWVRRPGGGHDRVGFGQGHGQLSPGMSLVAEANSEGLSAREGAVDTGHVPGAAFEQGLDGKFGRLSGSHH